jgi:O-antigen ligase
MNQVRVQTAGMGAGQLAPARTASAAKVRGARDYLPVKLDGLRLGLFLLILINVSRAHQIIGIIGKLRPGLLLVLFTGLYAMFFPHKLSSAGVLKTTEGKLIFWLFVTTCVSAVLGISLGSSAKFLLNDYIKVFIAAMLLLVGMRHVNDLFTLIWAYVVSSGVLSLMAIFLFKMSRSAGSAVSRLSNLYTFDSNDIGVVLMVGLPLTLLVFQHSRGLRKWLCAGIIAAIGVTLARSGSRGALVGLVGTGTVLLISLKTVPVWKRLGFVGAVVAALVLAAPPGYWEQMKTLVGIKQDYNWTSKDGRKELIKRGLVYMAYYPFTGLGIHNFQRAECMSDLSAKVRTYVRGTALRCQPPHNTYIEAGAETGFIGLGLFLSIVFGGIWRMRRLRKKIPKSWRTGDAAQRFMYDGTLYLPVAMAGFAITCFFVTFAWLDIVYIAAGYMAGLTLSVKKRLAQDQAAALAMSRVPAPPQVRVTASAPVPVSLPVV